ncbi:MAG: hypothetical protein NDI90_06485 [Nitrospira sp. BO4]|nr:hypothetical protein [Nitrospira sp. BO4]
MRTLFMSVLLAFLVLGSTGCASFMALATEDGLEQKISFNSDPPGVKLFLNGTRPLGETPFAKKIERSKDLFIIAKKEGFEDQQIHLTQHFNHWFWGNFVFGGLIGSAIDYGDGAVVQLDPTTYYINMLPRKSSLEQQRYYAKTRWVRNFLLVGYPHIQGDLVRGEGEYLSSVLAMLNVPAVEKAEALNRLKKISAESKGAVDFTEHVLADFSWSPL